MNRPDIDFQANAVNHRSLENYLINAWVVPPSHPDFSFLSYYKLQVWERHDFEARSWRGFIVRDCQIFQVIPYHTPSQESAWDEKVWRPKTLLSFRKILGHSTGFVLYKHADAKSSEIGV